MKMETYCGILNIVIGIGLAVSVRRLCAVFFVTEIIVNFKGVLINQVFLVCNYKKSTQRHSKIHIKLVIFYI